MSGQTILETLTEPKYSKSSSFCRLKKEHHVLSENFSACLPKSPHCFPFKPKNEKDNKYL